MLVHTIDVNNSGPNLINLNPDLGIVNGNRDLGLEYPQAKRFPGQKIFKIFLKTTYFLVSFLLSHFGILSKPLLSQAEFVQQHLEFYVMLNWHQGHFFFIYFSRGYFQNGGYKTKYLLGVKQTRIRTHFRHTFLIVVLSWVISNT